MAIIQSVPSAKAVFPRLALLLGATVLAFLFHLGIGGSSLVGPLEIIKELLRGDLGDSAANTIVWRLRLPRALATVAAGAILGGVGAAFQAFFRNPLAEPYIVGVSSGAGIGGTIAFILGLSGWLFGLGSLVLAAIGGLLSLGLVLTLSRRGGLISATTLLIAGVVVSAMLGALMTNLLLLAGEDTNQVLRWLMGSVANVMWPEVGVIWVATVVGLFVLQSQTRSLNALAVSEFSSERMGVDVKKLRFGTLFTGTVMTSVAVGAAGIIGFLGLAAPHVARRVFGPDLRVTLLASAVTGAGLLLIADIIAQTIRPGTELPVGAVTAVLGAPVLLMLLKKRG